jgi:hypothetical protein
MSLSTQQFRLGQLSTAARLAITCFVVLIGFGYLASVAHLYFTYNMSDGKPGMTPKDVRLQLAGRRDQTVLESKIVGGTMEQYLQNDPEGKTKMLAWIHNGARSEGFAEVEPVFAKNCASCHNSEGAAKFRPLTNFQQVSAVAKVDKGESPAGWARVAHIHLQSLAVIYLLLGLIYSFCRAPEILKVILVPAPFIAIVADFGARALVPMYPDLVHVVMLAGAVAGLSTAAMCLGTLWELWFSNWTKPEPAPALGIPAPQQT